VGRRPAPLTPKPSPPRGGGDSGSRSYHARARGRLERADGWAYTLGGDVRTQVQDLLFVSYRAGPSASTDVCDFLAAGKSIFIQ